MISSNPCRRQLADFGEGEAEAADAVQDPVQRGLVHVADQRRVRVDRLDFPPIECLAGGVGQLASHEDPVAVLTQHLCAPSRTPRRVECRTTHGPARRRFSTPGLDDALTPAPGVAHLLFVRLRSDANAAERHQH